MNILVVGDVVGSIGCEAVRRHLSSFKRLKAIDLVIANGENSADGNGITPTSAENLFTSGVDVITTGNHVFRRKEIYETPNQAFDPPTRFSFFSNYRKPFRTKQRCYCY